MHSIIVKLVSIFSLLIFLSPPVIEGLHDLQHVNVSSCNAKTEKHIHQESHHCIICGINVWISNYLTDITTDPHYQLHFNDFFVRESQINISSNLSGAQLRAPPQFQI
jgi:hypothetical protein